MPLLLDDIWTRRGISLIWGASGLARAKPQEVVPLRKLFHMAVGSGCVHSSWGAPSG